jgi:hypothetical protein
MGPDDINVIASRYIFPYPFTGFFGVYVVDKPKG